MEIAVDAREPFVLRSLVAEAGARVTVTRLEVGDYVVAPRCLVERKHVVDLHDSLIQGRLWTQLGRLRKAADEAYLLVEGRSLAGPVHPDSIRGALLAAGELGITVIRSADRPDSAAWLCRLAYRRQMVVKRRARPAYAQRPRAPAHSTAEAMLGAVPGISTVTARALLAGFGSIAALATAAPPEWRRVRGMGEARCGALADALGIERES